jgi:hypothetical protein
MVCLKSVLRAILTEKGPFLKDFLMMAIPKQAYGTQLKLSTKEQNMVAGLVFPYQAKMKPTLKYKTQKEIHGLLSEPRR